jgi:hypothetical protein
MPRFSLFSQHGFVLASVSAACVLLAGCGGGGGGSFLPSSSLSGVAAVGAGLANASVTAKCTSGAPLVGTTAADGSFTLSLSGGQVAPCMLQVVSGTPSVTLHGFATEGGRVNITPLTDLVVTKALGTDPAIGFASFDAAKAGVVKTGLEIAKTYVNAQLAAIVGQPTALDIMTGFFKVGDADDKLLDSLAAAIAAAGKTLADLRLGATQGLSLKPIIQVVPPVVTPPVVPPVVTPPVVTPPVVTPPVVTPPVVTPPVVTPPVVTPPVVTPPVVTPPVTPPSSGNECAPLLPKAGDSLTYRNTLTPGGTLSTVKYDYSNATYLGQDALALTVTTTAAGTTSSSVTYTSAATGAYLGATSNGTASTTVTTFDPPDYQNRINNAFYNIGQVATVAVKARVSGPDITNAFAAIGGGTALTMDYTFTVERKPNEALTVPAGTFANTCKLQVNVTINNVALEGNNGSNPLFSSLFPTISAAFTQPFKTTVWLTNVLPNIPKTFVDTTSALAAGSSTQELTTYTLAPR